MNGGICIAKYGRVSLPGRALFYIGPDHAGAGRCAADVLNSMTDGEGGAVVLYGDSADPQDSLRLDGMLGRIQELYSGISVYAVLDDRDTPAVSRARVIDCARAYPGLSALAVLSEGCTGAVQGLRETGLRENVSLVCFDRFPGGKEKAENAGADIFTISQDFYTQGRDSVILLYNYCVTGEHPANFYNFTKNFVTRGAEY